MAGPGLPAVGEGKGISLLDVAPTVLSLLGVPIPTDMEGKALLLRKSDSAYSEEDEEEVKERLRGLGYLG
jgi:arylsulfatase A-like enzyme